MKKCNKCDSEKEPYFSRIDPMGYFCPDCGAEDGYHKCKSDGCETKMSEGAPEYCPQCQGADIIANAEVADAKHSAD